MWEWKWEICGRGCGGARGLDGGRTEKNRGGGVAASALLDVEDEREREREREREEYPDG